MVEVHRCAGWWVGGCACVHVLFWFLVFLFFFFFSLPFFNFCSDRVEVLAYVCIFFASVAVLILHGLWVCGHHHLSVVCQLNDSLQPFNNPIYEKRPEAYPKHLYLMHKSAKSNTTGGNLLFFHHLTERFMPHLSHFF